MKRRLLLAGALATVLAAGTACAGGGDDTAGGASAEKLTIYTARDKKVSTFVVDKFTAKYPEYKGKVEVLNLGAQEILERVRAEKANPQADVWWGGTQQGLAAGASEDLLAGWQPSFAGKMDASTRTPRAAGSARSCCPRSSCTTTRRSPRSRPRRTGTTC